MEKCLKAIPTTKPPNEIKKPKTILFFMGCSNTGDCVGVCASVCARMRVCVSTLKLKCVFNNKKTQTINHKKRPKIYNCLHSC